MSGKLIEALSTMQEQEALAVVDELLEQGVDPVDILGDCKQAMAIVGENFSTGKYFLPELVMAGEMLLQISRKIKPKLEAEAVGDVRGCVVLGTVAGDLHDIGKDIVGLMLEVNGFKVVDLGIDVPAVKFVEAVKSFDPEVVALSGFLTLAFDSMKKTVDALDEAGLRGKVKIMIGGGQIDEGVLRHTGADDFGSDAMDAVSMAKRWVEGAAQ